jgi:hypothetical protein
LKDINDLWGLIELIENFQDIYENEQNNIVHFEGMRRSLKDDKIDNQFGKVISSRFFRLQVPQKKMLKKH